MVGSSEAMSGAGFGAEIDGHAVVVRVNWAPTAGRERDVGVRTDVRVIATWPSEGGAGDAQGGGAGGGGGAAAGPEQLLLRLSQGAPDVARFLARARTRGAAGRGDAIISPSFLGYLHVRLRLRPHAPPPRPARGLRGCLAGGLRAASAGWRRATSSGT